MTSLDSTMPTIGWMLLASLALVGCQANESSNAVDQFPNIDVSKRADASSTAAGDADAGGLPKSVSARVSHKFDDYTLEGAHLTHVEVRGDVPDAGALVAAMWFAPDGRRRPVGQLVHD
ncbi:MAG: hypothetical protein ABEN55_12845, partial [Bradymonadaceae bacterium]